MFWQLSDNGINHSIRGIDYLLLRDERASFKDRASIFLAAYQALPPVISSFIGYAIMHPELIKGLDQNDCPNARFDNCDDWRDANNKEFVREFCAPLLGWIIGYPLLLTAKTVFCITKHELSFNPYHYPEINSKIYWNLLFIEGKLNFLPVGTVTNALATTFWSSAHCVAYALFGRAILNTFPEDINDVIITYAVGGAVLPALVISLSLIVRALAYGEIKFFPPADYYNFSCMIPTIDFSKFCPQQQELREPLREQLVDAIPVPYHRMQGIGASAADIEYEEQEDQEYRPNKPQLNALIFSDSVPGATISLRDEHTASPTNQGHRYCYS